MLWFLRIFCLPPPNGFSALFFPPTPSAGACRGSFDRFGREGRSGPGGSCFCGNKSRTRSRLGMWRAPRFGIPRRLNSFLARLDCRGCGCIPWSRGFLWTHEDAGLSPGDFSFSRGRLWWIRVRSFFPSSVLISGLDKLGSCSCLSRRVSWVV